MSGSAAQHADCLLLVRAVLQQPDLLGAHLLGEVAVDWLGGQGH